MAGNTLLTNTINNSLFGTLGGEKTISIAIDLLYEKVINDKNINHFFKDMDVATIKKHQTMFFCYILGSLHEHHEAETYNLQKIHANLNISHSDFMAVATHLIATLTELNVSQDIIDQIAATVVNLWQYPKIQRKFVNPSIQRNKSNQNDSLFTKCWDYLFLRKESTKKKYEAN